MGLLDRLQLQPKDESETDPQIYSETAAEFQQDPEPGETPRRKNTRGKATPVARRTTPSAAKMAKEIADDLASLIEMSAAVWGLSDDCCAPTLEAQAKPIADSLVAILSRNPKLLAKFANTDLVAYSVQAGLLFKALTPVATAVYRNHVSRAVEGDQSEVKRNGAIQLGVFPAFSPVAR